MISQFLKQLRITKISYKYEREISKISKQNHIFSTNIRNKHCLLILFIEMRFLVLIVLALNLNYYLSLAASIRELKLSTREHFDTFINKYGKSFVNLEDKQKR